MVNLACDIIDVIRDMIALASEIIDIVEVNATNIIGRIRGSTSYRYVPLAESIFGRYTNAYPEDKLTRITFEFAHKPSDTPTGSTTMTN